MSNTDVDGLPTGCLARPQDAEDDEDTHTPYTHPLSMQHEWRVDTAACTRMGFEALEAIHHVPLPLTHVLDQLGSIISFNSISKKGVT